MVSVFLRWISLVIPKILVNVAVVKLCDDSNMAVVLNLWMVVITLLQTLSELEVKFGLKPKHRRLREWLSEEVSNLISRGDMLSDKMSKSNPFTLK
jgi:uncharacterized membrane protein YcaP (DUF421 family)